MEERHNHPNAAGVKSLRASFQVASPSIANGRLVLGIWQGIYLWEHRQHGQSRELVVHLIES